MAEKTMTITGAEMAKGNVAAVAETDVLAADEAHNKPLSLLEQLSDVLSTSIGLYEIRINLLLWRLFKMSKSTEGRSVADSGVLDEAINCKDETVVDATH